MDVQLEIHKLYERAYLFYKGGKYGEAETVFRVLTGAIPRQIDFWIGYGASLQMQKKYAPAVDAFSVAAFLDKKEENPLPHFHAAECLWHLDMQRAAIALKSARLIASKQKHPILEKLKILNDRWKPWLMK